MNNVILIRYGEIFLKGKNRKFFEDLLKNNIFTALNGVNFQLTEIPGRLMISDYDLINETKIINILSKQAGIFSISPAIYIDTDKKAIIEKCIELMEDEIGTFKVVTNRADKTFETPSMEMSRQVGGAVLKANNDLKVDVHSPDTELNIDIRENNRTYIFTKTIMGIGGMPVGSAGTGLLMLSGGIDSPVAGYMMAKRGTKLFALHFHSFPYTSELARLKVEELAEKIAVYNGGELEVYMCPMTAYQEAINEHCKNIYNITLLRRAMFRIAERLCKEIGIQMIITGESLGQVASQTIESMSVVSSVVNDIQIMRPLVAFDKQDTIAISRKIDTYQISIRPHEDCCTVFVPDNPVTKPKLEYVKIEERKFDSQKLIDEAYSKIEKVVIKLK